MSLASLWLSKNFCTLGIIQHAQSHTTLRISSISLEKFRFFTQPPLGFMHQVTFAERVECIDSASEVTHHGMVTLARILSLLLKTKISWVWRECWLHDFSFSSPLLMPMMVKSFLVNLSVGLFLLKRNVIQRLGCGQLNLRVQGQCQPVQVIPLKSIAQGAHLLPKYGSRFLPITILHINALDVFQAYILNPYIDHCRHKFLLG